MEQLLDILLHPEYLSLIYFCLVGVLASAIISFLPALHIYNVIGIFMLFVLGVQSSMEAMELVSLCIGMIVGYSMLNTVPATYFGPGDESMSYYILPSADWVNKGRGYEGVILTGIGSLTGIIVLALLAPLFVYILPTLKAITSPHMFWIIGAVIVYSIMSEWPKGLSQSPDCWTNFKEGWYYLGIGLLLFLASGLLGFIVMSKTLVKPEFAFQSITPVFVGLFAMPWLITNIINIGRIPHQHEAESVEMDWDLIARGTFGGFLGGFFAAFVPIVTAGVGGLMAGHATAQRDGRLFVMSYGTCKTVYYVGSFLLFFIPGLNLARGGLACIINPVSTVFGYKEYFIFVGLMLFAAGISFLLLMPFTKLCIRIVETIPFQWVSVIALFIIVPLVCYFTGQGGFWILLVSTGLGLIPVLFQARRMNLMGVLLLPVCLNMAGYGYYVVKFLGLL